MKERATFVIHEQLEILTGQPYIHHIDRANYKVRHSLGSNAEYWWCLENEGPTAIAKTATTAVQTSEDHRAPT
jgi:hypothetical protein